LNRKHRILFLGDADEGAEYDDDDDEENSDDEGLFVYLKIYEFNYLFFIIIIKNQVKAVKEKVMKVIILIKICLSRYMKIY